jgi:O-antigen/teichoic acid export membrane protein
VFAALIFAPDLFVRLLAGQRGAEAATLVVVLAVGNLFFVGSGPCSYLISMTGRAGLNFVNSLLSVIGYAVLGYLLIPRYGALGMAVGDAIVTAAVNSARLVQAKVLIGVQPFGRSFMKPVAATLAAAVVLIVGRAVAPSGIAFEIGVVAVAAVVYLAALRIMGIDPEERHVFDAIRSKVIRRRR